jgi:iron complex transport system ATP-binding protein
MADSPLIELDRVGYRQQSVDILLNVTWRVDRGDRWAVLGPNGCGKTTMLRVAAGYLWPTTGVVRRLGQELLDLRELRRSIGWVASDLVAQIPPDELAVETVVSGKFAQVGLRRYGAMQPSPADFAAARAVLQEMRCEGLADKPFRVLSQGERQQTLVARARIVDPLLVVLDEPCAGMDPGVRERFLHWLDGEAATPRGPALVFVTHHLEEVMPAFDRTLLMQGGCIVAAGPTQDVATAQRIAAIYGVEIERLENVGGRLWPIWATRGKGPEAT